MRSELSWIALGRQPIASRPRGGVGTQKLAHDQVLWTGPPRGRLPRTWIALLYAYVRLDLAGSTGMDEAGNLVKYLLAGAGVVMSTSALLRHGPEHARALLEGLVAWMARRGPERLGEILAMFAVRPWREATAYERPGYVEALRAANVTGEAFPW